MQSNSICLSRGSVVDIGWWRLNSANPFWVDGDYYLCISREGASRCCVSSKNEIRQDENPRTTRCIGQFLYYETMQFLQRRNVELAQTDRSLCGGEGGLEFHCLVSVSTSDLSPSKTRRPEGLRSLFRTFKKMLQQNASPMMCTCSSDFNSSKTRKSLLRQQR